MAVRRRDRQSCRRQLPPVIILSLRSECVGPERTRLVLLRGLQIPCVVVALRPHDQSLGQLPPLKPTAATTQELS